MGTAVERCIDAIWVLVAIYWVVTALLTKRTARRESPISYLVHTAIITTAATLLFNRSSAVGFLGGRVIPDDARIGLLGLGLTLAGCGFALWARVWLGSNWSARVTVKRDHQLVRSGPYAIVRHPIYSGFLLAMLGTALALGEVRGLAAVAVAFVGWFTKTRAEERFMVEQFDGDYLRYRGEVRRLIPFFF